MGKERPGQPSLLISGLSLAFMAVVLAVLVSWNESQRLAATSQRTVIKQPTASLIVQRRMLKDQLDQGDPLDITDDATRSATCKHYLYEFLNGTTDVNDECQAFKNAFNAADCQDDTRRADNYFSKRNRSGNDDLYIDDFFENWEVCDF